MKHLTFLAVTMCAPAFAAGNIAGLWHLDEGSGQAAHDSSGNGNNGQLGSTLNADPNDPAWTAGKFGSALQFNGTSDWVQVPNSPSLSITGAITIEAWIKLDSYKIGSPILAKWNDLGFITHRGYSLSMQFGLVRFDVSHTGGFEGSSCTVFNSLAFACTDSALVLSKTAVPLGKWTHVAAVFDPSNNNALEVFIDGVLSNSVNAEKSNIFDNTEQVLIGASDSGSATRQFFPGAIDEARVWQRALTPAEVLSSAQAGLRGLWHFNNDGADSSGYGNDVTLTGATFAPDSKFGAAALALDGTDDFASAPGPISQNVTGSLDVTGSITVEAWIKINALPPCVKGNHPPTCIGFEPIAAKWDDIHGALRSYALAITADGSVRFDVSHTGGFSCGNFDNAGPLSCHSGDGALVISSAKITLGTWYHIAGVFDANAKTLQVFVNGQADISTPTSGNNIFHWTVPFMIGAADEGSHGRQFTNGSIDEVQVWSRPLSAAEIAFQANAQTAGEMQLPATLDNTTTGTVFESLYQPGEVSPVTVLQFMVPDLAGTQINSFLANNAQSDGKVARLAGFVTGNSALDALLTATAIHDRNLMLDMGLSDNSSLDVNFQWNPAGPAH